MVIAASFGTGQVLWSMLWFFMFFIWLWVLFLVFGDIFRSSDLSGWAKALWVIFVVVLPWLGVLVYLIARGSKMHERAATAQQAQDAAFRRYGHDVATGPTGGGPSTADELIKLNDLKTTGVISEQEFQAQKAKLLTQH
jgi:hypothetical protein